MIDRLFLQLNRFVPGKWKWVLEHGGFKKYFANTGWSFFAQLFNIVSLLINIWLARYLGPKNYGIISYVFSFVGIFGLIAGLGINSVLMRDLVKKPEKRDEILGTSFVLVLLSNVVAFLFTTIAAFVFEPSFLTRSLIVMYSVNFIFTSANVVAVYFQATVQAKKNAMAHIAAIFMSSMVKIYLIFTGAGIIWLTAAFLVDFVVEAIINIYNYVHSGLYFRKWKFSKTLAKDFLVASWFMLLSSAAVYIYMRIDQVMIRFYLGEAAVGIYAAAVKFAEIWYFIPNIICSSIFPAIVNAKTTDEKKYFGRLKKLFLFLGGFAVIMSVILTLLAPIIIKIFFGEEYIESIKILQIYVWSGVGLFLGVGFSQYFMVENKLKMILFYNLIPMIINIVLNIILIPKTGLSGAAWATLISYSLGPIFVFCFNGFVFKRFNYRNI